MFRCCSLETSHPHLLPQSPKVCSIPFLFYVKIFWAQTRNQPFFQEASVSCNERWILGSESELDSDTSLVMQGTAGWGNVYVWHVVNLYWHFQFKFRTMRFLLNFSVTVGKYLHKSLVFLKILRAGMLTIFVLDDLLKDVCIVGSPER